MIIQWKFVPRQALIDALRNTNIGPSNLSAQDKADLVALAKTGLTSARRDTLLRALETEVIFRKGQAQWAKVSVPDGL